MITAAEARDLMSNHPKRVIGFNLKRCLWAVEEALMKKKDHAVVYGNVFGGVHINPPRPSYLKLEKQLKELGYEVTPIGGFFCPGIKIKW